jgi:hypothetical protein
VPWQGKALTFQMAANDEGSSWFESRRLIISQLAAMDLSIRDLSARIDHYSEASRERALQMSKEAQTAIADLNLRIAMLELRAKLWGGVIGLLAGGLSTGLVQLVTRLVNR